MNNLKNISKAVRAEVRPQVETLANAVMAMQEKIDQQIPVYKQTQLAQQVTVGTGETILRQNPVVQEFRATVRDYAAALKSLQDIVEQNKAAEGVSSLEAFRSKLKVAK